MNPRLGKCVSAMPIMSNVKDRMTDLRANLFLMVLSMVMLFGNRAEAQVPQYNLQTFKPSPSAIMLSGAYNSKCMNNPDVLSIPVHILSTGPVKLTLSLQGITAPTGMITGRVVCDYMAYMRGGPDDGFVWAKPFVGQGQTFYNGYWHPSPIGLGQEVTFLEQARFTARPKNELIFYHFSCGEDGCASDLTITYFQDHFPYTDTNLVVLRDNGLMTYAVKNGVITIVGCMSPPGDARLPPLCEIRRSLSLAFDESAHQMAIQNANTESEAFFNYLTIPQG